MNQLKYTLSGLLLLLLLAPGVSRAQCDQAARTCEVDLLEYLSDGQYYRVQVVDGESATLKLTLFQGFRYRIVACTEVNGAKINYEMYDGYNNKVFSNEGVPDGTGWDFDIGATDEYVIKAKLNNAELGCIVFDVGYDDELFIDDTDFLEEDDPFFDGELEDELEYDLDKDEATNP
jgi:hypothetical protein